jgi:hypothetical protein
MPRLSHSVPGMLDRVEARDLYEGLMPYEEADAYGEVIAPWLDQAGRRYCTWIAVAAECSGWWAVDRTDGDALDVSYLLWELYALSRVSDILLLGRQPFDNPVDIEIPGLALPDHEYLGLFSALGMTPFGGGVFDPFLHEIVEVEQVDDPRSPIEITEVLWPGLMLGDLLFGRAGVRVRAGAERAKRGVADRSPLYWSFRRRHRPTVDPSQGWGSNSQWRTTLRLDYRTPSGDWLNVDGDRPIDGSTELSRAHRANLSPEERLLTPRERRELLRHRCLLRVPEAASQLVGFPGWEEEFWPFGWLLPAGEG